MNPIQTFNYSGANVRTITLPNGEPGFVGKDVAELLGYTNPSKAMSDHCRGVTNRYPLPTAGGLQEVRVLSEPDVLRLIISSRLPAAEAFERWVFEEVLPSIRKTGQYAAQAPALLAYTQRIEALEAQIEEQAPALAALDLLMNASDTLLVSDAAKILGISQKELFTWMALTRWIYRRSKKGAWKGSQAALRAGFVSHKVHTFQQGETTRAAYQVRITTKGLTKVAELFATN